LYERCKRKIDESIYRDIKESYECLQDNYYTLEEENEELYQLVDLLNPSIYFLRTLKSDQIKKKILDRIIETKIEREKKENMSLNEWIRKDT